MQPGTVSHALPEVGRVTRHLSAFHPVHALHKGLSKSRASSSWVSRQGTRAIPPHPELAWVVEKRAAAPGKSHCASASAAGRDTRLANGWQST